MIQHRSGGFWCKNTVCEPHEERWVPKADSFEKFQEAIRAAFSPALTKLAFTLTNFSNDFWTSEDLTALQDGTILWIVDPTSSMLPAKERIAFPPHPKTLTRAGDYEYFAAQGRAPFPYALAELIDNSLRATMRGRSSQRQIIISFVLNGCGSNGLISVWDNGCGMTKKQLNEWAIMNLSMEDRGDKPTEEDMGRGDKQAAGASRFLNGNLSYFGVGSKNAAFYLGKRIKLATRHTGSSYVHELSIGASDLEQRYRDGQAVYEEDLLHRMPGDVSTLGSLERSFPVTESWVEAELASAGDGADSWTRIIIGELKPEVLKQIVDMEGRKQLCRSLAHLYHYYLHGEQGNRGGTEGSPRNAPSITLECSLGSQHMWQCDLASVSDDLESLYLQAQKAEMNFSLTVPDKGVVSGVLYYFPFENERETLPVEDFNLVHNPISTYSMTQLPPGSSQPPGTQHLTQQRPPVLAKDSGSDEEVEVPLWQRSKAPLFEAFWQGRLIPGARIESLPFIEAVRSKRGAAAKDVIPDESFLRLRGALFFGPGFHVTRNKLTFRDNLQELLTNAISGDRAQEKKFKDWLAHCHAHLDKSIRFEGLADPTVQAEARSHLSGESTAFERIADGTRTVCRGDIVRLAVKPSLIGKVLYFSISQDVKEEGVYANGTVIVLPLPLEVYGSNARRSLPLRRIEAVLSDAEAEEPLSKELSKVPATLVLEPASLASGEFLEIEAGQEVPETNVTILNGAKQKVVRGYLRGEKVSYSVMQRLWLLPEGTDPTEALDPKSLGADETRKQGKKKRGRKGRQPELAPIAEQQPKPPLPNAELVVEVENRQPNKDSFSFAQLLGTLDRAGQYVLQYTIFPAPPIAVPPIAAIRLVVIPGPAVEMQLQGEGRAAAATQELMLGEWLPDLHVSFKDSYGNATARGIDPNKYPILDVVTALPDDTYEPIHDLRATYHQEHLDDGTILLNVLQILGVDGSRGTSIFADPVPQISEAEQADGAKQNASAESREVVLRIRWEQMEPQLLLLRVLPGLPRSLRLLPGNPWAPQDNMSEEGGAEGVQELVARFPSGSMIPDFQVQSLDMWGNPTSTPCPDMPFHLIIRSTALEPAESDHQFAPFTTVKGLQAASYQPGSGEAAVQEAKLKVVFSEATEEETREVLGGCDAPELNLGIFLEPSTAPAALVLLVDGKEVPIQTKEDSGERVALVEGIEAGSMLENLAFYCADEVGRPAATGTAGKVQVSWTRGSKKVRLQDGPQALPSIQVQDHTEEAASAFWVRFTMAGCATLELGISVSVIAGLPHSWRLTCVDGDTETQGIDESGSVRCGQFFRVEVEALDSFNNRCVGTVSHLVPEPQVAPKAADSSEQPLVFDVSEWEQGWLVKENGDEVFSCKMRIGGNPGTVHLHVNDTGGPEGGSKLQEDCLDVKLEAGAPDSLIFDCPAVLTCGTHATLGELRVRATDAYGNIAAGPSYEVTLLPSAVSLDGSGLAASVTAAGGNKAKLKQGTAVFKDVKLSADQAGSYSLRAKPSSRKIAGEAAVTIQMAPVNAVSGLTVTAPELPADGLVAGGSCRIIVTVDTEDGNAIPAETAANGLTVQLVCPGGSRSDAHILSYIPEGSPGPNNAFMFSTGTLTIAGDYIVTAEFRESRAELAAEKANKKAALQSTAISLAVKAGAPHKVSLEAANQPQRLTVTNAAAVKERLLLKAAAVQVRDAFGNAVSQAGVPVHLSLGWPADSIRRDGQVPSLDLAAGSPTQETDIRGRAFFGDIFVVEGSGRVAEDATAAPNTPSAASMELELKFIMDANPGARDAGEGWTCVVLFADNAARFSAMRSLNEKQHLLAARHVDVNAKLEAVRQAAGSAAALYKDACKAVEAGQKKVKSGRTEDAAATEAALLRLRQLQESAEAGPSFPARFGAEDQPMTKAIMRCQQSGEDGLIGVFAQLATVHEPALARVLSANWRSMLVVLIVENADCRDRLAKLLSKCRLPMPDILSLSHVVSFTKAGRGEAPGSRGSSELARQLLNAACSGTDPPLPLPLPHTRVIMAAKRELQGLELGPNDWPQGCCGYAFNLVRPVLNGHRASLLYNMFGQTLVFETLELAQKYREFCTQVLKHSPADMVTLDLKRISGKGIISGSSFRVPPLAEATICFGSTPLDQVPEAAEARQHEAALQQLLEAFHARDNAARQLEEAQEEEAGVEEQLQDELDSLEAQIRDINVQLGSQAAGKGLVSSEKKRARRGRSSRTLQDEQEEANPVDDQENAEPASKQAGKKGKEKRRRLTKAL